ncbi:TPA: hypothetical protein ACX3FZ_002462 [Vibrio parahaemolyticus]|uniref:hypothetical protein n=1 Tax=Vibrio parahaemolyticus TaxID=670 RepID=UPI000B51E0A0|nr:hypothetical protein [Vibrio parahaemolyticus]EGQ8036385.1 hypothetical protein [Vibrio parahaemolyticus]EGQ8513572.1 hypothetical protein [Vibrio parahaemolyticus]EGR9043555.1 hypothetical protein [Vibrio parahaemolyticus]EHH2497246.1 hypothetical protein [Vibrio parahaemolyticus]EID4328998.1 hypothetical protein [Vibrio parahaemolyticus]
MSTLPMETNDTNDWKLYPNSSNFSGMVQNGCDYPIYLYVTASGVSPAEQNGVVLKGGIGESLPVSIPDTEELHFKPVTKGPVKLRLA